MLIAQVLSKEIFKQIKNDNEILKLLESNGLIMSYRVTNVYPYSDECYSICISNYWGRHKLRIDFAERLTDINFINYLETIQYYSEYYTISTLDSDCIELSIQLVRSILRNTKNRSDLV
jgi:hypothetical protein